MDYAIQLLATLLIMIYAGMWLDKKIGTSPWFTILGCFLGMIFGLGMLYKQAMAAQARQKLDKEKQEEDKKP